MLVKLYGPSSEGDHRYSPPEVIGIRKDWVMGQPDAEHVSTSIVERQNLTMRMNIRRLTRLTNAHSKKIENHMHAIALHSRYYNFGRSHETWTRARGGAKTSPARAAGGPSLVGTSSGGVGWTQSAES